ncbi:MAG: HAD superfamily hydrolase (TIGR01544 family) [Candidatus Latescibacterota bacterium]|jgi:HAD superfamily hydrolase (TIGR01544 family)
MDTFCSVGADGICVVSDWDRTLTYPKTADGQETTSYLVIVHGGYLGDGYRDEMARLYVKYRSMELATDVAEVDKLRSMNAWWVAAFELLKAFGLTREMIQDVGTRDVMVLRDGAEKFFQALDGGHIPLQVVSAGLGDVIVAFLEARGLKRDHMDVVANWLQFDEQGLVTGCGEPVIHSANKTQLVDVGQLGDRTCVLLLGDTLEDADMVTNFEGGTVIRVGFLNEDTQADRAAFAAQYDVVIENNGDFGYVNDLLSSWILGW